MRQARGGAAAPDEAGVGDEQLFKDEDLNRQASVCAALGNWGGSIYSSSNTPFGACVDKEKSHPKQQRCNLLLSAALRCCALLMSAHSPPLRALTAS